MIFRRKGDKNHYDFLDADCIGRPCWSPGIYQHRGATMAGGSRNTGDYSACCMNRAYDGCSHPLPERDAELAKERRERWRKG